MSRGGCLATLVSLVVMISIYVLIAAVVWDRASSITPVP